MTSGENKRYSEMMNSSSDEFEGTPTVTYIEAYRSDMAVEFLQQASSYYCYTQPVVVDNDYYVDRLNMPLVTHITPNIAAAYFNGSDHIVNTAQLSTPNLDHTQEIQKMYLISMDEVTWSYIVFTLAVLPIICYTLVFTFMLISIFYARCRLHRKVEPSVLLGELPGVSIIKPLMGVDPFLETNLESHFLMNYPKFELLCCVQDDQDPAVNLVYQLKERYPKVDCKLFVGGKDGIVNPMVNNMVPAYDNAKYDIIWVSTSRIKASTDILLDMVAKLQSPKVALVHQMPFTTDQKGLAATIEKIYFGATVARYYLAFNVFGIPCFTGMSYLVKKPCLDELGGLSWFGRFLAEDFFIAKLLHEKGYTQVVAAVPAQQNVNMTSIAAYKDRMVRWVRLRMNMMPFTTVLLEPLGESLPLGIYVSWSMHYFFGINPYVWFACHWTVWFLLDMIQFQGIQKSSLPVSWCSYALAWVIRELLYVLIYFEAIINVRHVTWGKRTYRLSNFGESVQIVSDKGVLPI